MVAMTTDIVSYPDNRLIRDNDVRRNQHQVDDDPGVPAVSGAVSAVMFSVVMELSIRKILPTNSGRVARIPAGPEVYVVDIVFYGQTISSPPGAG
ncbi:hypothetical protein SAMN06296378_2094 [Salinibacterium xinjiangense]|uniref:Uncharacterized protein n=1 Tax=Salinibacterium xinjiangense TaxID=386302 RepID=A0A2C8ZW17_9MICO|nr:hypothetical protein SAMN06296378_2094 [Salinibacterium xinjiangense]